MKLSADIKLKVKCYVGFALKSKKVAIGQDKLLTLSASYVTLLDSKMSAGGIKKLSLHCKNNNVFIIDNLEEITSLNGCLAIGVRDNNLASAIIDCLKQQI